MTNDPDPQASGGRRRRLPFAQALSAVGGLIKDRIRLMKFDRRRRRVDRIATDSGSVPVTFYYPRRNPSRRAPGVLVLHTAFGRTHHEDSFAVRLAEAGFVAVVASFSARTTGEVLQDPAGRTVLEQRVAAARDCLAADPATDPSRLGAVGFSLGGHFALHLAIAGSISAAVAYYGVYPWPSEAIGRLRAPVLLHQGDADSSAFVTNARAFADEALRIGKPCELVMYPNVRHQFDLFEPRSPCTREAEERTIAFLKTALGCDSGGSS
jgi:carboxymethylenebutenolidase